MKTLTCTCGDCSHWEFLEQEVDGLKYHSLKCVTCGVTFGLETDREGGIIVPKVDHLFWISALSPVEESK